MSDVQFATHFDHIKDARRDQGKLHRLGDILTIALCAVLAGAEGWEDMATFARIKETWLTKRLDLQHGVPSSDTFRRAISTIEPEAFARGFLRWVGTLTEQLPEGEVVAIDGKTVRGSYEKDDPKAALHMISAWATEQRLVLAQQQVEAKTNEITAIPALLEVLDLEGCIVTIDAMGTQREIAGAIRQQEADYVLALKANQGTLHQEVRSYFEEGAARHWSKMPIDYAETSDLGHGRKELRRLWVSRDVEWLPKREAWADLSSIVMIEHERHTQAGVSLEQRFYISSLKAEAEQMLAIIRSHWGIENSVHWVLDVVFREDESRIRRGHGGANMATMRHMALNLLRQDSTKKMSLRMKRKRAGWDQDFVADLIGL